MLTHLRRDTCPACDGPLIETNEEVRCIYAECEFKITKAEWQQTLAIANFAFMLFRMVKSGRVKEAVTIIKRNVRKLHSKRGK